jgi:predicted alpha/beta hydrolase family esterase
VITTLILPGLYDSGPEHWQSHWERVDPSCRRVVQADWETPRCADWVAHWARDAAPERLERVRGALLVAPSDPEGPHYLPGPTGFAPVPMQPLPFPSIVVTSPDDVYVTPATARAYADAWGSRYVELAPCGHVNSASGLGMWPTGYALLEELRATPARVPTNA